MTYKIEMVRNSIGGSKCHGASMHVRALCQQGMGSVLIRGPSARKPKREYDKNPKQDTRKVPACSLGS